MITGDFRSRTQIPSSSPPSPVEESYVACVLTYLKPYDTEPCKHSPGLVITEPYFLWLGPAPRLYTPQRRRPEALNDILGEVILV